jgi:hypothetical protein
VTIAISSVSNGQCTNNYPGSASTTVLPLPIPNAGADQVVCAGTQVTLTANSASIATDVLVWTTGVDNSGNPTGVDNSGNPITNGVAFTAPTLSYDFSTTLYTLTATASNGCTATDQVAVTVNPIPQVLPQGTPIVDCEGQSSQDIYFYDNEPIFPIDYNWVNNNTNIGLGASGTTNDFISGFTLNNPGNTAITATIDVFILLKSKRELR